MDERFAKWHGIDRKKVEWYPKVDTDKCIGCGLCAVTCGRAVYKFDFDNKKTVVDQPYNCLVGCQTCSNLCPAKVISFGNDTRAKAQGIIKKFKVVQKAGKELESRENDLEVIK